MAVAFDAASQIVGTTTGDLSWTHTPTGTPSAVLVGVVAVGSAVQVSGVTYGGVSLTPEGTGEVAKATGETTGVQWFLLDSGAPSGAQTVYVTVSGGNVKKAYCITLTAAAAIEVVTSATWNSDSLANPSGTLSVSSRSCFSSILFGSGQGTFGGITALTGWTGAEVDFGTQTGGLYYRTTVDTSDVTTGWTQTADDAVGISIAVSEVLGAYSLACAAGSFTLTGQTAALRADRRLTLAAGSYSLTGQAAALAHGYLLAVTAGSYAVTGTATALAADRTLALSAGAFTLSGQAAALVADRTLALAAGSYALTGQAATLTYTPGAGAYTLACSAGAFTLTGQAAGLTAARKLVASPGAYTLTGNAAGATAGRRLAATVGSFSLSGRAAALLAARRLQLASGAYALAGHAVALTYSNAIVYAVVRLGTWRLTPLPFAAALTATPSAPALTPAGLHAVTLTPG